MYCSEHSFIVYTNVGECAVHTSIHLCSLFSVVFHLQIFLFHLLLSLALGLYFHLLMCTSCRHGESRRRRLRLRSVHQWCARTKCTSRLLIKHLRLRVFTANDVRSRVGHSIGRPFASGSLAQVNQERTRSEPEPRVPFLRELRTL